MIEHDKIHQANESIIIGIITATDTLFPNLGKSEFRVKFIEILVSLGISEEEGIYWANYYRLGETNDCN